jgi:sulfur relay (sulfurtransferase) complex TusBCD TusD component (DsrE family)
LVNRKILALLLTSAAYGNQYADHMCRVALRAQEKGYEVEIFLFGAAVRSQLGAQGPEGRFPVGANIGELMDKGAKVYGCRPCFSSDGYGPEGAGPKGPHDLEAWKVMEGVEMVPVSRMVDIIARADRVLSFGGG